jgi:hypothetical protein
MAKEVIITADKVKKRKLTSRVVKISLLVLLLLLIILYIILEIIYNEGRFTVTLDSNKTLESGLSIFDSLNNSQGKRRLYATPIKFMDNISYKWLPENIDTEADGSHNGENYIAYSFYIENQGNEVLSYWYEVIIDDVIKNVDEAIRIRIYRNGEDVTYAKKSSLGGQPEPNTTPFKDIKDAEGTIILEEVSDFKPMSLDRFTIVVWLEGDDPDCTDPLIGGELKMHMVITEKHVEQNKE